MATARSVAGRQQHEEQEGEHRRDGGPGHEDVPAGPRRQFAEQGVFSIHTRVARPAARRVPGE